MINKLSERGDWEKIGTETIEIEVEVTDNELLLLGKEMTEFIKKIDQLKGEVADIKKDFKAKIDALKRMTRQLAEIVNTGRKTVPRTLPVYLDGKSRMRIYVDESTGEIVETRGAYPNDFQRSFA